jgi:hypothetical protein
MEKRLALHRVELQKIPEKRGRKVKPKSSPFPLGIHFPINFTLEVGKSPLATGGRVKDEGGRMKID